MDVAGTDAMDTLTLSSKGQLVIPVALRRRLGLAAGAKLHVSEEAGRIMLSPVHRVVPTDVAATAGMLKARPGSTLRRLENFDPASLLRKTERASGP
jgi:AbrB family looped-hinge helix DNA binding protein